VEIMMEEDDHGSEVSQWRLRLEDLPSDIRAEIRSLYKVRPLANVILLLYPASWIVCIAMMERWPFAPVRLAGIIVIAVSVQAMGTLMHEALHGNVFRSRFWDRWVGFACGIPTFFSSSAYKVTHLNHHRHTRSERDIDEFSYSCKTRRQYVTLFYSSFLIGSILYMFVVPVRSYAMASRIMRGRIVLEYAIMISCYATAIGLALRSGHAEWLLWYWFYPICIAILLSNTRALAEHMGTSGKGDALSKTRTTTSNPVVSFLMLNLNYHIEHHLFPGVPWYNLPRIHRLLKPMYLSREAEIRTSYAGFVLQCLRKSPEPLHVIPARNTRV